MTATATEAPAVPDWLTVHTASEPWEIVVPPPTGAEVVLQDGAIELLGLDVETTGLDMFAEGFAIRTVQLSTPDTAWVLRITSPQMREAVTELLNNPHLRFVTHGSFDPVVLRAAWGVDLSGRTLDSHLLSRLVVPGDEEDHGLKALAAKWIGCPELGEAEKALHARFKAEALAMGEKDPERRKEWRLLARSPRKLAGWGFASTDTSGPEFTAYAAMDAACCLRLAPALVKVLGTGRNLVAHEMRLADLAVGMRCRGIQVDVDMTEGLLGACQVAIEKEEALIAEAAGVGARSPRLADWLVDAGFEFLDDEVTVGGRPSLAREYIDAQVARAVEQDEDSPVARVLSAKQRLMQETNNAANLEGFLKFADSSGRVHPDIKTLRARTSRMSMVAPALQTIKAGSVLRGCLAADPGTVFISVDFDQIELRVAAALSGDDNLSAPILAGQDLHADTARRIFGEGFTDEQRKTAKMTNFASLYGGGAKTVAAQAGIPITEARTIVNRWRQAYPQVAAMAQSMSQRESITTPTGRVIPLDPSRPYAASNFAIQSTARDIFVIAILRIADRLGLRDSLVLFLHDEVVLQAPEADAERVLADVVGVMGTTIYGIPITSSGAVLGTRWGKLP